MPYPSLAQLPKDKKQPRIKGLLTRLFADEQYLIYPARSGLYYPHSLKSNEEEGLAALFEQILENKTLSDYEEKTLTPIILEKIGNMFTGDKKAGVAQLIVRALTRDRLVNTRQFFHGQRSTQQDFLPFVEALQKIILPAGALNDYKNISLNMLQTERDFYVTLTNELADIGHKKAIAPIFLNIQKLFNKQSSTFIAFVVNHPGSGWTSVKRNIQEELFNHGLCNHEIDSIVEQTIKPYFYKTLEGLTKIHAMEMNKENIYFLDLQMVDLTNQMLHRETPTLPHLSARLTEEETNSSDNAFEQLFEFAHAIQQDTDESTQDKITVHKGRITAIFATYDQDKNANKPSLSAQDFLFIFFMNDPKINLYMLHHREEINQLCKAKGLIHSLYIHKIMEKNPQISFEELSQRTIKMSAQPAWNNQTRNPNNNNGNNNNNTNALNSPVFNANTMK